MRVKSCLFAGLAPAMLLCAVPAEAAESYDNCLGFLPSLPTTIQTQGVYCMNKDLASNLESGVAINIQASNVTLDCNGFKLGNLQAGFDNLAFAVQASNRVNVTVRNCNVRGYGWGIHLVGSGQLVEDNRVEASGTAGITVSGDGSTIRRNAVLDTGTGVQQPEAGIVASGVVDVMDNTITGVYGLGGEGSVVGMYVHPGVGGRIEGNAIRGVLQEGIGSLFGIFINNTGGGVSVARNRITNGGALGGFGIQCAGTPPSMLTDNHVSGFVEGWNEPGCADVGLNHDQ